VQSVSVYSPCFKVIYLSALRGKKLNISDTLTSVVPVILISRHFDISMGEGGRGMRRNTCICTNIHTYTCIPTYILITRCIHEAFSALNFDLLGLCNLIFIFHKKLTFRTNPLLALPPFPPPNCTAFLSTSSVSAKHRTLLHFFVFLTRVCTIKF